MAVAATEKTYSRVKTGGLRSVNSINQDRKRENSVEEVSWD